MANGLRQMQRLFGHEAANMRRSWRALSRRKFASYDQPRLSFDVIAGGEVSQAEVGVFKDKVSLRTNHTRSFDYLIPRKEVVVFLHGLLGNAKNLRTPGKCNTNETHCGLRQKRLLTLESSQQNTSQDNSLSVPPLLWTYGVMGIRRLRGVGNFRLHTTSMHVQRM